MAVSAPILVVLGPTASGKSELALELARRMGGELLSVDSMQVYRGMNIGTAKPSSDEQAAIRHHLIDLVEPSESFTVARFVASADAVLGDTRGRGAQPIAVGGTPLYYKALFEGMFEGPEPDPELRQRLRSMGNEDLHRRLIEVDPQAATRIHVNDTKRLVRALEVYEQTGQPISTLQTDWTSGQARHRAVWVGLHWEKEAINRRINARVKAMMAAGWVEETRQLLGTYGALSRTAAEATGYREIIDYLHGRMSLDDATEQIKIATRQLARRQMKWFRRFAGVHWIAGEKPLAEKVAATLQAWEQGDVRGT